MFGSDILEVAIGIVFVYLLMSLIATAAQEALETWLKTRGLYLEQGLMELFDHDTFVAHHKSKRGHKIESVLERFYNHPLIFSLFRGSYRPPEDRGKGAVKNRQEGAKAKGKTTQNLPSYIPSTHFANAVLGVAESYLKPGTGGQPLSIDRLTLAAWATPNIPVRRMLLLALASGKGDLDAVRTFLENWFDGAMDRVSGWYKRRTHIIVFFAGLALCVLINVNTLVIAHALHQSTALRLAIVDAATKYSTAQSTTRPAAASQPSAAPQPTASAQPPVATAALTAKDPAPATTPDPAPAAPPAVNSTDQFIAPFSQLEVLNLPIGWGQSTRDLMAARLTPGIGGHALGALELALGWLMTAFAITLGAPFWFDVLNTIMVVRSTVKPTEKSPIEPSKDGKGASPSASAPPAPASSAGADNNAAPVYSAATDGALEISALDPALRPREEDLDDFQELAA